MTTAPHLREYWLVKCPLGYVYTEWPAYDTDRSNAVKYPTRSKARKTLRRVCRAMAKAQRGKATLVHVTVTTVPKGQRAAWERVVEAARKLEASWGVKLTRGESQRALTGLFAAVRALESK